MQLFRQIDHTHTNIDKNVHHLDAQQLGTSVQKKKKLEHFSLHYYILLKKCKLNYNSLGCSSQIDLIAVIDTSRKMMYSKRKRGKWMHAISSQHH